MNRKTKIFSKDWIYIIFAWVVLYYFYFIISFWGLNDFLSEGIIKEYINKWYVHFEMIFGTVLFGFFFCLIDEFTDRSSIRRKSFGKIILIKSMLYILMTVLVFTLVYGIFYYFEIGPLKDPESLFILVNYRMIIGWSSYFIFSIFFITFAIQINKKVGPGNLLNLVTGKYHNPREEQRIFLFIDLKDSTTIAENLGHKKYSKLLQSCYHDLTEFVKKYNAEIYQYVGDEVVLSWMESKGLQLNNSIKLFYAFKNKLDSQKEYYLSTFGVHPEFKGGMDAGLVTAAEVGDIKREIAYHGDVLNTAARIQEKCREYEKDLLISEHMENKLFHLNGFTKTYIGDISLKGKKNSIKIFSIDYSSS